MLRVIHPNRWFFWTIAALLAVGLVLLVILVRSNQEIEEGATPHQASVRSYEGWKTFSSKPLGLQIKYPPSWQVDIDPVAIDSFTLENPQNFSENVTLTVTKPEMYTAIRDSLKYKSESEYEIMGNVARVFFGDNADPATKTVVLWNYNDKLYYIAGQAREFEKIVTSIRLEE